MDLLSFAAALIAAGSLIVVICGSLIDALQGLVVPALVIFYCSGIMGVVFAICAEEAMPEK